MIERTWLGEDVRKSAQIVKDYVTLLTNGAPAAHAQQFLDDQQLADDQEDQNP